VLFLWETLGIIFRPPIPNGLAQIVWYYQLICDRGWHVSNIDSVVVAERPKLKPHIEKMRSKIASVLQIEPDRVGVKATTNEKLGPEGREEGICAYAVVLLARD
jgi:2-C-methyl-D-erythritol 2,4-cyclodiphosphate synthase